MVGKKNKSYQEKIKFILACWISSGLLLVNNSLLAVSAKSINSDYLNSKSFASKKFIIAKPPDERQPEAVEEGIEKIPTSETPVQRKPSQPIESPLPPTTSPEPTPTVQPSPTSTPSSSEATPTVQPSPTQPTVNPTTQPNVTPTTTPTQTAPKPQRRQPTTQPNVTPTTTPTQTAPKPQRRQPTTQPNVTPTTTPTQTAPNPQRRQPTTQPNVTPITTPTQRQSTPIITPINRPVESSPTNQPVNPTTTKPSGRTIPQRQRNQQQNTKSPLPSPGKYKNINFVDVEIGVLKRGDFQSRGRYFHFYEFEGTENQLIEIRLAGSIDKRRSNNLSLDPFMFLLDSNNQVLLTRGSNEISSGRVKSAFAFVRLPATGRYTIAVTSRNPGDSGRYSLALRNDRASYALDKSGVLTTQTALRKKGNPYSVSKFQGRRDQLVSIRADSIYEDFSPYIVLLNSRGEVVARDNDKDGKYSALIDRVRLPQDDTYYVVVLSAIPREKGTYRLTIF
ncbi:peptidase-like protein [Calothrix sp. NIES-4105]|nr:peptidase-like protein [Calothrix sp. NIES-4105]